MNLNYRRARRGGVDGGRIAAFLAAVAGRIGHPSVYGEGVAFAGVFHSGDVDAAFDDVVCAQHFGEVGLAVAVGVNLEGVAGYGSSGQRYADADVAVQLGFADEAVVVGVFGDGHHRFARCAQLQTRAVAHGAGAVAGHIADGGGGNKVGVVGGRVEFDVDIAGIDLCLREGDHFVDVAAAADGEGVARCRAFRQGNAYVDVVVFELVAVDVAVVVGVFGDFDRQPFEYGGVDHRRIGALRACVAGRIGHARHHFDLFAIRRCREAHCYFALGYLLGRQFDAVLVAGVVGNGQDVARNGIGRQTHCYVDVAIKLLVVDVAVVVGIFYDGHHRCARLVQLQRRFVFSYVAFVAGRIAHLRGGHKLGAVGRGVKRGFDLTRVDVGLVEHNLFRGVAGAGNHQQIAGYGFFGQRNGDVDLTVQFVFADVAVVVGVFVNHDGYTVCHQVAQIQFGAVAAFFGYVAGRVFNHGGHDHVGAVGRRRKRGGDVAVGFVFGRNRHFFGEAV